MLSRTNDDITSVHYFILTNRDLRVLRFIQLVFNMDRLDDALVYLIGSFFNVNITLIEEGVVDNGKSRVKK